MNILVIASHPDDEVLGMGGTIKKLSKLGHKIFLCVVSDGSAGVKKKDLMIKARKQACLKSAKILPNILGSDHCPVEIEMEF